LVERVALNDKGLVRNKVWQFVDQIETFHRISMSDEIVRILTTFIKWEGILA
jgi:hypothetical protein